MARITVEDRLSRFQAVSSWCSPPPTARACSARATPKIESPQTTARHRAARDRRWQRVGLEMLKKVPG